MCGIAGYWGSTPPSDEALARTLASMKQRGPDYQRAWRGDAGRGGRQVCLLHARLSIIDLDVVVDFAVVDDRGRTDRKRLMRSGGRGRLLRRHVRRRGQPPAAIRPDHSAAD